MATDNDSVLEYLRLQRRDPHAFVTRSELIAEVREAGYQLSARQLTYYTSVGLVPHSMRIGTHTGVYPAVVMQLVMWILRARDTGVSIEALRELRPVWKFLVQARVDRELNIERLEYVAGQHITSTEARVNLAGTVADVMGQRPHDDIDIVYKDRTRVTLGGDQAAIIGFATVTADSEEPGWFTCVTIGGHHDPATDPTIVILSAAIPGPTAATTNADTATGSHSPAARASQQQE